MIQKEDIQKLALKYQTPEYPNVIREYFQHLFLFQLYKIESAENLLFKGGTALRMLYNSPRFSEDLDFSIFNIKRYEQKKFIENLFTRILFEIERIGIKIEVGSKPGLTTDGYYTEAIFDLYDYPQTAISLNISSRNGRRIKGEVDSIINDFIPAYNLIHLPQNELVEEKIFDAMLKRKKARDFYDLYFLMRKNLITGEQKKRLNNLSDEIKKWAKKINFGSELRSFLPRDQQIIIKDFKNTLVNELNRQLSGL